MFSPEMWPIFTDLPMALCHGAVSMGAPMDDGAICWMICWGWVKMRLTK